MTAIQSGSASVLSCLEYMMSLLSVSVLLLILIGIGLFGFAGFSRREPDDPDVGVGCLNLDAQDLRCGRAPGWRRFRPAGKSCGLKSDWANASRGARRGAGRRLRRLCDRCALISRSLRCIRPVRLSHRLELPGPSARIYERQNVV